MTSAPCMSGPRGQAKRPTVYGLPPEVYRSAARLLLLQEAQAGIRGEQPGDSRRRRSLRWAGNMFEDDTRDGDDGWWQPRHRPDAKRDVGAVSTKKEDPVQERGPEKPKTVESRPAVQRGPGQPRKVAESRLAGQGDQRGPERPKEDEEPQPAIKRRPGRPRKVPNLGSGGRAVKADGMELAAQNPGERLQTPRRGHSKEQASKE
jgi:hypothetical protein